MVMKERRQSTPQPRCIMSALAIGGKYASQCRGSLHARLTRPLRTLSNSQCSTAHRCYPTLEQVCCACVSMQLLAHVPAEMAVIRCPRPSVGEEAHALWGRGVLD